MLSSMSVGVPEFFRFAASPGINIVRESVWVESAANKLFIVTLVHGEWCHDGVWASSDGCQEYWVDGWDSGLVWHFSSLAPVTVPVFVTVVVQWVDSGTGPEEF